MHRFMLDKHTVVVIDDSKEESIQEQFETIAAKEGAKYHKTPDYVSHVYMCVYMHLRMYMCVLYVCVYKHFCMYIYIYIYIYIYK